MSKIHQEVDDKAINLELETTQNIKPKNDKKLIDQSPSLNSYPKLINNKVEEVKQVFGFNENA